MFGMHWFELIPLLLVAVIFLGPKRLPDAGKSLGKAIRGFREETQGLRDELAPVKTEVQGLHSEVKEMKETVKQSVAEAVSGNGASAEPVAAAKVL